MKFYEYDGKALGVWPIDFLDLDTHVYIWADIDHDNRNTILVVDIKEFFAWDGLNKINMLNICGSGFIRQVAQFAMEKFIEETGFQFDAAASVELQRTKKIQSLIDGYEEAVGVAND